MQYIKVTVHYSAEGMGDILVARLADMGYEGFEEGDGVVMAYIPADAYAEAELRQLMQELGLSFDTEIIEPRNWNEVWESAIQPVVVEGFCTVRAHFNTEPVNTPYEIIITPKMSFGTGHHATTQLMMMGMKNMDLAGNSVLDFGTGTGVLAILADKLGASEILAIDNDEWSVENTQENIERNSAGGIEVALGSLENVKKEGFDVILANINRHILLQYMQALVGKIKPGGILLMSGLLTDDEGVIREAATGAGFTILSVDQRNGWISILTRR